MTSAIELNKYCLAKDQYKGLDYELIGKRAYNYFGKEITVGNKFDNLSWAEEPELSYLNSEHWLRSSWKGQIFSARKEQNFKVVPSYIVEAIEEARVLLTYEFDWDDNGGLPTDEKTFNKAIDFLKKYSEELYKQGAIIQTPYIDIMPDGGVSVKWDTIHAQFLIIFNKTEAQFSYFYGERKNIQQPTKIKDGVKNYGSTDPILLMWMKSYLCF